MPNLYTSVEYGAVNHLLVPVKDSQWRFYIIQTLLNTIPQKKSEKIGFEKWRLWLIHWASGDGFYPCLTSVDSHQTSPNNHRNKNRMTFRICVKRPIICIWSRISKIGGLEGTEHWTLHVNVYKKKKKAHKVLSGAGKNWGRSLE